jgi:hypothetical protein
MALAATCSLLYVAGAFSDAGNPIAGTIQGDLVKNNDGTWTVYVRGQWDWLSHGSDCNTDRAATGVGIIWNDPTEPGYTVTKGTISAGVGIASLRQGDSINKVDRMVHPVDVGNSAEGYAGYPGQVFVDPTPPDPNSYKNWKGGCGREPLSATNSPGPGTALDPSGKSCATGNTACAGHPWGSWGYSVNGGSGYTHTYAKRSDITKVCVNFYDVKGGGTGTKLQAVGAASNITVNGNTDNSIQTNAYDTTDGANCVYFPNVVTVAQKNGSDFTNGSAVPSDTLKDKATLSGAPGAGDLRFQAFLGDDQCQDTNKRKLDQTMQVAGNGTYTSNELPKPVAAGTYYWLVSYTSGGTTTSSTCGDTTNGSYEQMVVDKQPTTTKTGQKVSIKDVVSVGGLAQGAGGTVDFTLYDDLTACQQQSNDQSHIVLKLNNVALGNDGTANTGTQSIPFQNGDHTYYWLVHFDGDSQYQSSDSNCTERFSINGNDLPSGVDP